MPRTLLLSTFLGRNKMPNFQDLTGKKFSKLLVLGLHSRNRRCKWTCRCDCGNTAVVLSTKLNSGHTKSCGCSKIKHGHTIGGEVSRHYQMWDSAKQRARKKGLPFNISLEDIIIPEFCPVLGIRLSVLSGPYSSDKATLDRIVPQKGYVKGNVVVISMKANMIKNDATSEEIRKVAEWLANQETTCKD